jgi:hypothetical protein
VGLAPTGKRRLCTAHTQCRHSTAILSLYLSGNISGNHQARQYSVGIQTIRARERQRPHLCYRSDEILRGLKGLAERWGVISARLIDDDPNLPSSAAVAHHFGKLSTAYQLIGVVRLEGKPVRYGLLGK